MSIVSLTPADAILPGAKARPENPNRAEKTACVISKDSVKWKYETAEANARGLISSSYIFPADLREKISRRRFAHIAVTLYGLMSGQEAPSEVWELPNLFKAYPDNTCLQAYHLGIMNGTSETTFGQKELLTREQAAVILARVYEKLGGTIPAASATSFADDSEVSGYAKGAVAFMAEKGILGGVGDNRFNPQGSCKCEEALIIALRMLDTLK